MQEVNEKIEKYHDFWSMVEEAKLYASKTETYYGLSSCDRELSDLNTSKTRKRFTNQKKCEIRLHYLNSENLRETARAFGLNESTVRGIVNSKPISGKVSKIKRMNHPGAGRKLSYPAEIEEELVEWILILRDKNFPVSTMLLKEKAKKLISQHNPSFKASSGWMTKFLSRNKFTLRNRTSVCQKLPAQLEKALTQFYADAAKFMRIGKYPPSLVGNMDETPAFFDMVPSKCISRKGSKECVVRTTGCEKKHLTVVLSATGDGKMLPPMIIFKGKTDKTIKDLDVPVGFVIRTQEKAWMDNELMHVWLDEIWLKHVRDESKKLGFENSLLTFDAFSAHLTDSVKQHLLKEECDTLTIPAGCTSKCQPMDVCLNRPFKAVLRKCWVEYISNTIEEFDSVDPDFKIPSPTRQNMVDWVKTAYDRLAENTNIVRNSFEVCGITASHPNKVRNSDFHKKCMEAALLDLEEGEEEDPFDDL